MKNKGDSEDEDVLAQFEKEIAEQDAIEAKTKHGELAKAPFGKW